ncbi:MULTISPECIES: hypothetical protein [Actinosynnema]|uniref:hypothetical protein n=1 Tax=Actinosynnema TaxID=40566 RepID=UPI0020A51B97|nr:hypothetical protein [Actinosynnema pretiosum]MCP2094352.1 hypothetical protein [Actinosynnema pretiosum]
MRKFAAALLSAVCLLAGFTGTASASARSYFYTVPSLPWAKIVDRCIGGAECGGTGNRLHFTLEQPAYLTLLEVRANDDVADRHNAVLRVYVDGGLAGQQDVKQAGSTLSYPLYRFGEQVVLESVSTNGGTEETQVVRVRLS